MEDKNLRRRLIPLSSTLINCMLDRSSSSLSLCQPLSVSLSPSLSVVLSLFLCLPNNGLFVMQEASSTSIIRPSFHPHHHRHRRHHLVLRCNKYGNEQEPVIGNFKLGSLVLKKDTNVLIAGGRRNPIFCGH